MVDPVVTQDKPNDDFEAAFAQISEADAKNETVKPEDIKAAPVVEKTAEQVEAERVAAEAAAATTTTEPVIEKTAEEVEAERVAAEAAAKADDQNLVSRLATLIKGADPQATAREVAAAAQAEAQRIAAEKAAADEATRAQQMPQLSKDELALVAQVEKDFPDVARAQAIVRRAEYQQVVKYIFDEVTRANAAKDAQLAPFLQLVQNLAERTHVGDLKSAVPDYDKLDVQKLRSWVETQPSYLKGAYDQVLMRGTAEDVKDLVARFYTETGVRQPVIAADPKAVAAAAAAETARKKAVAALAPVASSRAAAPAGEAPKDFDNAFAEFAQAMVAAEGNDRFSR